ncbi:MAG: DUF5693 family protein [Armatimonadota bacterium]
MELVVNYSEIAQLVSSSGKSSEHVLSSLKKAGVTTVAVSEPTIGDLMAQSQISIQYPSNKPHLTLVLVNPELASQISTQFENIFGAKRVARLQSTKGMSNTRQVAIAIFQKLPAEYLQGLPAGLPNQAVREIRGTGLCVAARLANYSGATPSAIYNILTSVRSKGITKIIFQGDQILGFRGAVKDTARFMTQLGLTFGEIEFAKQKGETELARNMRGNVLPLHSITQNEMPTLSEEAIVERYSKAVRERSVRLCYIRMYYTASKDPLASNCSYIRRIAQAITRTGHSIKPSHAFAEIGVPRWLRVLVGAGVAAGALLLVSIVVNISGPTMYATLLAGIAACCVLAWTGDFGRKIVSLVAALVFPTLGGITAIRDGNDSEISKTNITLQTAGRLMKAVAISIAGGVLIVGLLSSRTFMLRIDQFAGIKLAHILPILMLAAGFAGGILWQCDMWQNQKDRLIASYKNLILSPVMMWQAMGIIIALVMIGLMVARTGNEAGIGVSPIELKLRTILDNALLVRPRTKEFLVGHPLLFYGIACALRNQKRVAAVLVTLGSIGLVSVLNTFCHIHTPLVVSVIRTFNGFVLGLVLGIVIWAIGGRFTAAKQ